MAGHGASYGTKSNCASRRGSCSALRQIGVTRGAAFDEFEAVGLGRHRHTGDWQATSD